MMRLLAAMLLTTLIWGMMAAGLFWFISVL